ncbi:LysR family transcriptional regulator [Vreelandella sp. EE22]
MLAIKAFEAAARLGSFKKAAEEISINPTGVSHHVTKLEQRLGVRLFHRNHRQITLTAEGRRLSEATTRGLQTIQTALDDLMLDASRIRVDTTSSFAALVLIPGLHDFYQQHPHIAVDVSTGETLGSHVSQLSIRLGDVCLADEANILKVERYGLYGTASALNEMQYGEPAAVYLTRWKNDRLPAPPWAEWLAANGKSPQAFEIRYFDQELYGVHEALAGKGLVFCSATLVDGHLKTQALIAASTHSVESRLCYYTPMPCRQYPLNVQALIGWLQTCIH